jgi:hypothetical protein
MPAQQFDPIVLRYEGLDTDHGLIDLGQLGQSAQGAARLLASAGTIVETGHYAKKSPAMSVRVMTGIPRPGSFEIVAFIVSVTPLLTPMLPAIQDFAKTSATKAATAIVNYAIARIITSLHEDLSQVRLRAVDTLRYWPAFEISFGAGFRCPFAARSSFAARSKSARVSGRRTFDILRIVWLASARSLWSVNGRLKLPATKRETSKSQHREQLSTSPTLKLKRRIFAGELMTGRTIMYSSAAACEPSIWASACGPWVSWETGRCWAATNLGPTLAGFFQRLSIKAGRVCVDRRTNSLGALLPIALWVHPVSAIGKQDVGKKSDYTNLRLPVMTLRPLLE